MHEKFTTQNAILCCPNEEAFTYANSCITQRLPSASYLQPPSSGRVGDRQWPLECWVVGSLRLSTSYLPVIGKRNKPNRC